MRFVTYRSPQGPQLGLVSGERVLDVNALLAEAAPGDMLGLIERSEVLLPRLHEAMAGLAGQLPADTPHLGDLWLEAPIGRPRKNVMCIGLNYAEHASEGNREPPPRPAVFTKAPTAVIGPYDDILVDPAVSTQMDWEVELAVVIGRGGRGISRERALDHVFGYTVINDVSARDIQTGHGGQFFLGKSLDTSCPMGPMIVTHNELPDPQALRITSRVNGVTKQESDTGQMIFTVAVLIEWLSRGMTLEPGDLIATGTPSGVGRYRTPPEFLQPGDLLESEVEGIGILRNPVAAWPGANR